MSYPLWSDIEILRTNMDPSEKHSGTTLIWIPGRSIMDDINLRMPVWHENSQQPYIPVPRLACSHSVVSTAVTWHGRPRDHSQYPNWKRRRTPLQPCGQLVPLTTPFDGLYRFILHTTTDTVTSIGRTNAHAQRYGINRTWPFHTMESVQNQAKFLMVQ